MEKKEMKWYETPSMEVLDMNVEGFFCASNDPDNIESDGMGGEGERD